MSAAIAPFRDAAFNASKVARSRQGKPLNVEQKGIVWCIEDTTFTNRPAATHVAVIGALQGQNTAAFASCRDAVRSLAPFSMQLRPTSTRYQKKDGL
ncbi:hypothetical protein [Afipia sp. GAS231]|jgi:hypothetical protein|uniref:hypothetical protein n=1 Tax=Afipia sp. GAS231 TaxID=1882747 RepID=UPI0012FB1DE5